MLKMSLGIRRTDQQCSGFEGISSPISFIGIRLKSPFPSVNPFFHFLFDAYMCYFMTYHTGNCSSSPSPSFNTYTILQRWNESCSTVYLTLPQLCPPLPLPTNKSLNFPPPLPGFPDARHTQLPIQPTPSYSPRHRSEQALHNILYPASLR